MRCSGEGSLEKSQKVTPRRGGESNSRHHTTRGCREGVRGNQISFKMRCCREGSTTGGIMNQDVAGGSLKWRNHRWGIAMGGVAGTCGFMAETQKFQF